MPSLLTISSTKALSVRGLTIVSRKKALTLSEYRFQEFPKMKYHSKHEPRIVQDAQDAQEEKALGRGWVSSPNDLPKPSRAILTLRQEVKPWWEEWKWLLQR